MPSRNTVEQMARVGMMSSRVEQASASPARIQTANRISIAAGITRQSMPVANARGLPCWSKKLITINATVTITSSGPTPIAQQFAIDPNFRVGYVQIWYVSAQRDLPLSLQMLATYRGRSEEH